MKTTAISSACSNLRQSRAEVRQASQSRRTIKCIPKKAPNKGPKPQPIRTPKLWPPPLTAKQKAVRVTERLAALDWQRDREDQEWHDRVRCRICGTASHFSKFCDVQYCLYTAVRKLYRSQERKLVNRGDNLPKARTCVGSTTPLN